MILLTGSTGFVGSHFLKSTGGDNDILQINRKGIEDGHHIIADLTNDASLKTLKSLDVDVLIHLASAIPGRNSDYFNTNVIGTFNLLNNINKTHLKKVILLSSLSVYGNTGNSVMDYRENNYTFTEDQYGRSKLMQEMLVRTFCDNAIDCLIFRASSIYGPGNTSHTLLPIFYNRALNNEDLLVQVKNYQQNFVYVGDVVNIIRQGIEKQVSGTYNLFSGDTVTIESLADLIIRSVNSSSKLVVDYKDQQHYHKVYNRDKLLRDFDCSDFTSLENGIKKMGEVSNG